LKISTYKDISFEDTLLDTFLTDNELNELDSFMAELDQLLQVESLPSKNTTELAITKIMEMDITKLPNKKIRTRNVKGIYRREHTEGKNKEIKEKSGIQTKRNISKVNNTIKNSVETKHIIPSEKLNDKLDVACKGGFVLLPKIPLPMVNGKLPIMPLPSRKSIITPRILLPKY